MINKEHREFQMMTMIHEGGSFTVSACDDPFANAGRTILTVRILSWLDCRRCRLGQWKNRANLRRRVNSAPVTFHGREARMVFHRGDGREKRERLKFSDWKIEARNDNKFQTRRA